MSEEGSEKFSSRGEAIDFGKDYEYLMAAYYGLTFSLDDKIADFKISSNNNDMGDFDDVVLEVKFTNGEEHVFALQLKHVIRPIQQVTLVNNNKKFSLQKYSKEFQKIKENYTKIKSYTTPFEHFHFILFSNSSLEGGQEFGESWTKLEPIANGVVVKIEPDVYIRRSECFGEDLLSVSHNEDKLHFKFKSGKESSPDAEFFQQFSFYTKQKNAQDMELHITSHILKTFKNCNPNIVVSYLNYFSYWCRRDYGTFKLTKQDVSLKLAELVLTSYIPDPDLGKLEQLSHEKSMLLFTVFMLFDVILLNRQSENIIDKIWDIVLVQLRNNFTGWKHWSLPVPNFYISAFKHLIPLSAMSENFHEISVKKLYILMWHCGGMPMVLEMDQTNFQNIRLGIDICHFDKKKFILFDETKLFKQSLNRKILKNLSDIKNSHNDIYQNFVSGVSLSLQGRPPISLKELMQIDECLSEIISTTEMVLMLDNNFVLGKDHTRNFPKPYVKRSVPKILISTKALSEIKNDLFVVSYIETTNLNSLYSVDLHDYFSKEQDIHKTFDNNFFISTKSRCTREQFEEIFLKNPELNCHHLRFIDNERLEWVESYGDINKIRKYRLDFKNVRTEYFIMDDKILNHFSNRINVICADSGMGKSVILKVLMINTPSNYWVVVINLGEHSKFFKQKHDINEVLNYFLVKENQEQDQFLENIINVFASKKQIVFLWDGFDEVPTECTNSIIETIKDLSHHGFFQWLSARTNSRKFLEDSLSTLSLSLTEFSQADRYNYIYCALKEKCEDEKKVEEIVDILNQNISAALNCGNFDYTGIPLHIHMAVEICLQKFEDLNEFEPITLADIYQRIILGKFDNFFEKAGADFDNPYIEHIREEYKSSQWVLYENAAIATTFPNQLSLYGITVDCKELFDDLENGEDTLALIIGLSDDGKFLFSHKAYEEFLAASWLVKHRNRYPELVKTLFEEAYSNIRLLFDMLLVKDSPVY